MARHETEREDLFAESAALIRRAELSVSGEHDSIVLGQKRDGAWSIYFGGEPVFHFDAHGRLKRAFAEGRLYRTQGATLAELRRDRTDDATVLRRRDLPHIERGQFITAARSRITRLLSAINCGHVTIIRSLPTDFDPLYEVATFLTAVLDLGDNDFLAPRFRGKR